VDVTADLVRSHGFDAVLFGARNRLYLSRDGGRFWSALTPELPEIRAVLFTEA
jgi:hypothetical protein